MKSQHTPQIRKGMSKAGVIWLILIALLLIAGIIIGWIYFNGQNELEHWSRSATAFTLWPTLTATKQYAQTNTPTLTSPPTMTWTPTPTEFAVMVQSIGNSVQGRSIESTCLGSGDHILVIIAGIHGDEVQPRQFVRQIMAYFSNNPQAIPYDNKICGILNMNPDGSENIPAQRFNANYVDLNRNWATSDWLSDINRGNGILAGGGGSAPLSEPENAAVAQFLLDLQADTSRPVVVFFYHSTIQKFSDVRPGYTIQDNNLVWGPLASRVAQEFAVQVDYEYLHAYEYAITGESLHWMAAQGIVAVGVEMPDSGYFTDSTVEIHIQALANLLLSWPENYP